MRIIFVRHGEPDYANDSLTENGILQAKCTAERLHNENIQAIYSSPNGRAQLTASFTAKDHNLDVKVLDYMREIDWGDVEPAGKSASTDATETTKTAQPQKLPLDGHPWSLAYMLLTEHPEYIGSNNWDKHHYFADNRCTSYFGKIPQGLDELLAGYGLIRKNGFYYCQEENNSTIAIFAHGGSGSILFSHLLNLPFPTVLTVMPYGVCSVSVIDFSGYKGEMIIPRLELFNDMAHLENISQEKMYFGK
jgi:probable phosphoglycerate mutase